MQRRISIISLILFLAILPACIHKTGGQITPWERVHTYNAAFAQANLAFEQGTEAVVSAGLLPASQGAPLIAFTGQIAQIHQQITAILSQGSATTANVASVKALIDQMKASGQQLPASALGIKNPKSQQTFQQDMTSLFNLADAILSSLQAVGVGQ